MIIKKPKFPIFRSIVKIGGSGEVFRVEVSIKDTDDLLRYPPDGIKAVYRAFKIKELREDIELVILIDNHMPFNYHEHDKLPDDHNSRLSIDASNWQEAWRIFDLKIKEILK